MSTRHRRRRSKKHHLAPPGTLPGVLIPDPLAKKPEIRVFAYSPQELVEKKVADAQSVREFLHKYSVLWVDVDGLGDVETVRALGELFGLHPLALEDVLHVFQRPKLEQYGEHYFLVARMASLNEHLETEQLSVFVGQDFVLTFQDSLPGDCLDPVRNRIRNALGRIRHFGPDHLVYALLDAVVDCHFPVLESYGEQLDALEDRILEASDTKSISRVHAIKRDLLTLRRAIWPLRDILHSLLRDDIPMIKEDTRVYLRDCYDHTVRIIEMIETYRELCADLVDLYLSSVNNRMSEVMKVLTVFSALFIPLTFIVGIYGMNFDTKASPWNMPELLWPYGYPLILVVLLAVAVALLAFFHRKGWLAPMNPKNVPRRNSKPESS
jgi:magnesium transporter